jgi:hypothetical protein
MVQGMALATKEIAMLERFRLIFTMRHAAALALMAAFVAAAAGWKLGSGEAIGRYLAAPVTHATIEENVTAVGALR